VFVVSAYYAADDAVLAWLLSYAEAGGHLVLGPRTGYADTMARARLEVAPGGGLAAAAGAWYDEYTNPEHPVPVVAVPVEGLPDLVVPAGAGVTSWIEDYETTEASVVARYDHPFHGSYAALTTKAHGAGRVSTIGGLPDPRFASAALAWAGEVAGLSPWRPEADSVRVHSAVNARGERLHVVQNWSWEPASVAVPFAADDLHSGEALPSGAALDLGPWDVRVLVTPA